MIEGGRLCTQQFPLQEQKYNIPTHLLAAISTTESGRFHKGLGMAVPWPWTINVEGKGYWFPTKAEAIAATQNHIAQGRRSIDVGCMQVNLKHHSKAFANLDQAFDPETNVAYAARFLRDNYADLGDWIKATAAYHSRTQVHGQRYLAQIEKAWNKIVAKVAAARASQNGGPSMAMSSAPAAAQRPATTRTVAIHPIEGTRNQRVIKVADATPVKKSEILVIRGSTAAATPIPATSPSAQPQAVKVASAVPVEASPLITPGGNSVRRVELDNPAASPQPVSQGAPSKFVFAN